MYLTTIQLMANGLRGATGRHVLLSAEMERKPETGHVQNPLLPMQGGHVMERLIKHSIVFCILVQVPFRLGELITSYDTISK